MKKHSIVLITSVVTLLIFWSSCNKKEQAVAPPLPGNEFLTTMVLKAVNASDPTDTPTAKWVKLNPNDTSAPNLSHAILNLKKNATYNVQVLLLDETQTPAADITSEIHDRENYHLFCFDIASGLNLTVKRTDHDTNTPPLEVGLLDQFTTGNTSTGSLEVTLHHQPNVKNGSCDPGSIDIDCTFSVNVQ